MPAIGYADLRNAAFTETQPHLFVGFASDLDATRNGFPRVIETTVGNKLPFIATTKKLNADGDIEYVRYTQQFGCVQLKVFND